MFAVRLLFKLKMIQRPSGDHAGLSAPDPAGSVNGRSCRAVPSGRTRVMMPYGRSYAIHDPSGDHAKSRNAPPHGVMRRMPDPSRFTVNNAPAPGGLTPAFDS